MLLAQITVRGREGSCLNYERAPSEELREREQRRMEENDEFFNVLLATDVY